MVINIQAIKFDATEKLNEFITKHVNKLDKFYEGITSAEITLKVVKPETANNKEVSIKLMAPGAELFATKISDTFEQSTAECCEALQKQLIKNKEKKQ